MNDKDLNNIFRGNSEMDQNFEPNMEGWDKISDRLDADDRKKRRAIWRKIPWVLAAVSIGVNVWIFSGSNEEITQPETKTPVVAELPSNKTTAKKEVVIVYDTVVETITKVKENVVYNGTSLNSNRNGNNPFPLYNKTKEDAPLVITARLSSADPNSLTAESANELNARKATSNKENKAQLAVATDMEENTFEEEADTAQAEAQPVYKIKRKRTSVDDDTLADASKFVPLHTPKEKKSKIGITAGYLIPTTSPVVSQNGYGINLEYRRYLKKKVSFRLGLSYNKTQFEFEGQNANAGWSQTTLNHVESIISTINTDLRFLNLNAGLDFSIVNKSFGNIYIFNAFGVRHLSSISYNYEVTTDASKENIEYKSLLEGTNRFIYLDIIPGIGYSKNIGRHLNYNLEIFYNKNLGREEVGVPDYLSIHTGLFYRF